MKKRIRRSYFLLAAAFIFLMFAIFQKSITPIQWHENSQGVFTFFCALTFFFVGMASGIYPSAHFNRRYIYHLKLISRFKSGEIIYFFEEKNYLDEVRGVKSFSDDEIIWDNVNGPIVGQKYYPEIKIGETILRQIS